MSIIPEIQIKSLYVYKYKVSINHCTNRFVTIRKLTWWLATINIRDKIIYENDKIWCIVVYAITVKTSPPIIISNQYFSPSTPKIIAWQKVNYMQVYN